MVLRGHEKGGYFYFCVENSEPCSSVIKVQ